MQKTLSLPWSHIRVDPRSALMVVLVWGVFFIAARDFFRVVSNLMTAPEHSVHAGLYYTFEYNALVEQVETGQPFDFEKARGWRRGPAAYLWMWPFAKTLGLQLNKQFIFLAETLIILACVWISCLIYTVPGKRGVAFPLYASLWLGALTVQYRVSLGDINSLFGFALFPMLGFYFLFRGRTVWGSALFAVGSHFRILSAMEIFYLIVRSRKALLGLGVTTFFVLTLGHWLISPQHGYLYWWTLITDILGKGTDTRMAAINWHENIAIPGVVLKILSGFHFRNRYALDPSPELYRTAKIVAALIQLVLFLSILRVFFSHRKTPMEKTPKLLLLNEFGFASLLTYFLAPEYGNDFLVTLLPAFLFGAHLFFVDRKLVGKTWWGLYLVSVLLTLNVVGHYWLCKIIPLDNLNQIAGNSVGFGCYESLNVFLIPVIGLGFLFAFLLHTHRKLHLRDALG